jgi:mono/diheme cytochrome c family protein
VRRHDAPSIVVLVGALLAIALGGMSLGGHAASIGGPMGAALDWAHLLGVAAWLGALPAVGVLATRSTRDRRGLLVALLRRHGSTALVAAPVVVLSGIANSPLVLGRGRDLVASDYGNLLVAKALLVGIALGIGAVNHLALRARGRVAIRTLLGAELMVAILAVAVAATMVTIQPASARRPVLNAPPIMPAHFSEVVGPVRAHLAVSLPAPGQQAYRVTLRRADSEAPPPDVQKVFLTFAAPAGAGLAEQRVELVEDELGGLWLAAGPYTPLVGDWSLELTIRRSGALDESVSVPLTVLDPGAAQLGPPPDSGIGAPAVLAATWGLVPAGAAGWLVPLAMLAFLLGTWRLRPSTVRDVTRGMTAALLVVAMLATGSRDLVAAANVPRAEELAEQEPLPSADPEHGRAIYLANCASCHGIALDGDGPVRTIPPAGPLGEAVRSASDAELSYRISYGVAGTAMPAFAGSLTAEERSDLIGYLRQQAPGP